MCIDKLYLETEDPMLNPCWDYFLRSITPRTVPRLLKNVGIIYPVKSLKMPVSLMVCAGLIGIRLYTSLFISEFLKIIIQCASKNP